jgi:iron(III) transport system permease protein
MSIAARQLPTISLPSAAETALHRWRLRFPLLPLLVAGITAIPVLFLAAELLTPDLDLWAELWATTLPRMLGNTLLLMLGVGAGTLVIGTGLAWLVVTCEFPGRKLFERALLLPLAVPAFVMGFVFMALFDYAGPVQTLWRSLFGRSAAFPDIQTGAGVIIVMTLVLYPYVYLLARAAFREQARTMLEAGRMLGCSRRQTFFRLALPMARPSLAAGLSLVVMEAMTDFATVRFFSFPTISEGVVRLWEGRMDRIAATELASLLMLFVLVLLLVERSFRGRSQFHQQGGRGHVAPRAQLRGGKALLAFALCGGVLFAAFILPVGQLVLWAAAEVNGHVPGTWETVYGQYVGNTFGLAGVAALVTVGLALLLVHGVRGSKMRFVRHIARLSTLGYALPGSVIAAGVLLSLASIDHTLNNLLGTGLILTGSLLGLIYAYCVRFMAVAYQSVDASMEKVKPCMEEAAQTLGARRLTVLRRVQAPLVLNGVLAGGILVFVDVMKELPATLLLRPFGMDTLGVWAYMLAAESFWQAASIPALTIVVVGLIPVFILMRDKAVTSYS